MPTIPQLAEGTFNQQTGCLECPENSRVSTHNFYDALETFGKETLSAKIWMNEMPRKLFVADDPTYVSPTRNRGAVHTSYSVSYPGMQDVETYDTAPTLSEQSKSFVTNTECGPQQIGGTALAGSSIMCSPPSGAGPIMGKDITDEEEFMFPLSTPPICVNHFESFEAFNDIVATTYAEMPKAAMIGMSYEKIRRLTKLSYNNTSAVAGNTQYPSNWYKGYFGEIPTSPGSMKWAMNCAEHIGIQGRTSEEIEINVSPQVFEYWILQEAANKGYNVNVSNPSQLRNEVIAASNSFANGDKVKVKLGRTGRIVCFSSEYFPIYVHIRRDGTNRASWRYQPFQRYRPGDDNRPGQVGGVVEEGNPDMGLPCVVCPETHEVLKTYEIIPVRTGEAYRFESWASNPLGAVSDEDFQDGVFDGLTSGKLTHYFGSDLQNYYLDPLNKNTAACHNNRLNNWWASEYMIGTRIRTMPGKRGMGFLMVQVPSDDLILKKSECLTSCCEEPVIIEPGKEARGVPCEPYIDVPTPPNLESFPDCCKSLCAPATEPKTICVNLRRVVNEANGYNKTGEITATVAGVDGTAVAGTHYNVLSTAVTIEDGSSVQVAEIEILPFTGPDPVTFDLVWTPGTMVPQAGACLTTKVCIFPHCEPEPMCPCASPLEEGCC